MEAEVFVMVGPASPWRRYCEGDGFRVQVEVLIKQEFLDTLGVGPVKDVFGWTFVGRLVAYSLANPVRCDIQDQRALKVGWNSDKDVPAPERCVTCDALESG